MIHSIAGKVEEKGDNFAVVNCGGIGYRIFTTKRAMQGLNGEARFLTYFHVRESAMELYGFLADSELRMFELLISISGVGPKSALSILETASIADLTAAIYEGRADLLSQASGIGRKTAERIIVELKGKVQAVASGKHLEKMEKDDDLVETLAALGYKKADAKAAVSRIGLEPASLEERLKIALKALNQSGK